MKKTLITPWSMKISLNYSSKLKKTSNLGRAFTIKNRGLWWMSTMKTPLEVNLRLRYIRKETVINRKMAI